MRLNWKFALLTGSTAFAQDRQALNACLAEVSGVPDIEFQGWDEYDSTLKDARP